MEIGSMVWFIGDEVKITTEPYEIYGGVFQDAVRADGKVVSIATKEQREKDALTAASNWKEQQKQFSRLQDISGS